MATLATNFSTAESSIVTDIYSSGTTTLRSQRPEQPRAAPEGTYCKYFSFVRQVGDGTYGKTWLAVDKRSNKRVLAKLLRRTDKNKNTFQKEWRLSRLFSRHPHIIHTFAEAYENDDHRMMIQEYADGGDLCSAIKSGVGLSQVRARRYLGQIAQALQHVHSYGFVHRDVKPENVVLVNVPCAEESSAAATYSRCRQMGMTVTHAKLIDFGLACRAGTEIMPAKLTIPYLAPEVCCNARDGNPSAVIASPALDVWSLGVTLFTMLTGMFPWKRACAGDANYDAFARWVQDAGERVPPPPMFARFSWQLLELFRRMLAIAPEQRSDVALALHYLDVPWFSCAGDDEDTGPAASLASRRPPAKCVMSPSSSHSNAMSGKAVSIDSGISDASLLSWDSSELVASDDDDDDDIDAGSPPCRVPIS